MPDKWSPQEILKIASKIELHGQSLYASLESKTNEPKLKYLWGFLKEQEVIHRQIFENMLLDDGTMIINEFGTGEYDDYMEAIASEYIITPQIIEEKLKMEFKSDLAAVDFALSIEKEAVLVYTALKHYINEDKQHILDKIINEEKKHIVELSRLKQVLKHHRERR
jgi:rubrerythrin